MPKPKGILPNPWKELYQTKNNFGKEILPVKGKLCVGLHPLNVYRGLNLIEAKLESAILGPWKICLDRPLEGERKNGINQGNTETGKTFRFAVVCMSILQRYCDRHIHGERILGHLMAFWPEHLELEQLFS